MPSALPGELARPTIRPEEVAREADRRERPDEAVARDVERVEGPAPARAARPGADEEQPASVRRPNRQLVGLAARRDRGGEAVGRRARQGLREPQRAVLVPERRVRRGGSARERELRSAARELAEA